MANYYDWSEGQYISGKRSDDELWTAFDWLFSKNASNDTSYKFIFFRSLLDCVEYGSLRVSFDLLFERFTYYSWPLVLKYHIRQKAIAKDGRKTELENILNDFHELHYSGEYVAWDNLFKEEKEAVSKEIKKSCKRYVVGAFYGDTREMFYSFSKKNEWIEINPEMKRFLNKNKSILLSLNYNKWSRFYENKNKDFHLNISDKELLLRVSREGESLFRSVLAFEFELDPSKGKVEIKVNTLALLFEAEQAEQYRDELQISNEIIEEELYQDNESMRMYLDDPVLLISKMKKKMGICV